MKAVKDLMMVMMMMMITMLMLMLMMMRGAEDFRTGCMLRLMGDDGESSGRIAACISSYHHHCLHILQSSSSLFVVQKQVLEKRYPII